jgi:rubrerythrin
MDAAVLRVREAGGPDDRACYTCECGYLFLAKVSTTVRCPHCGAGQAW